MASKSTDINLITFSVRVYQLLLNAYPAKFQQEYGLHMAQVFQDCCLRTVRQGGANGMLKLWTITLLDLLQSVISEHAQKETEMNKEMKPEDIRRAGWALILGAVSFILIILSVTVSSDLNVQQFAVILLVFVSLPLLAFGVLGLRHRYGEKVGSFGKNILLIGAILGPITSLIGFFLLRVGRYWFITWTGLSVLFACLILFGIVALYKKPLPRWNILPIIAGFPLSVIGFYYIITGWLTGYWEGSPPLSLIIILLTIQGIALVVLGYILKSDMPEETTTPA
jgi:hypothetical protein